MLHVSEECCKKFSQEVSRSILSVFLFIRFICPAIVTPDQYKTAKELPSREARRSLILVSKVLTNISTGIEFDGSKESFMLPFNDLIVSHRNQMNYFYNQLINASLFEPIDNKKHKNKSIPTHQLRTSLTLLLQSLLKSKNTLLSENHVDSIIKISPQHLNLLQKLFRNFND